MHNGVDFFSSLGNLDKCFNEFVTQVEIRFNKELPKKGRIETEDSVRYVFFDVFRKIFHQIPLEEYHLEYPLHDSFDKTNDDDEHRYQKIDMCLLPIKNISKQGLALEFKYDRYNFRNFTQRRAAFFADIFRLVLFQPEIPMCRFFIYLLNEVAAEKEGKKPARKADAMYTHLQNNARFGEMELSTIDNPFHLDQDYISYLFHPTKKNKFMNDFLIRFYGKNHRKNIEDFLNTIKGLDCQLFCHFKTPITKNNFIDRWKIFIFEITR